MLGASKMTHASTHFSYLRTNRSTTPTLPHSMAFPHRRTPWPPPRRLHSSSELPCAPQHHACLSCFTCLDVPPLSVQDTPAHHMHVSLACHGVVSGDEQPWEVLTPVPRAPVVCPCSSVALFQPRKHQAKCWAPRQHLRGGHCCWEHPQ